MHRRLVLVSALCLTACASYTARPLDPAAVPAGWNARRLNQPAVLTALDSAGLTPVGGVWSGRALGLAAWVLRPERRRIEAEVRQAEAARRAAGGRPQPGIELGAEHTFRGGAGEPPLGVAVTGVFTVELGGKRGARLARANAGLLVMLAAVGRESSEVAWRVRRAGWEAALAGRVVELAEVESELLQAVNAALAIRYAQGTVTRFEVLRAEQERWEAEAELARLRREAADRRAALAEALGVPLTELEGVVLGRIGSAACTTLAVVSRDSLQRQALEGRPELAVALAEYQVAEAELRIEVSNSWPDLTLAPGLFFDHGANKWTIGLGLPSVLFDRHRGPIAEATAAREVAALRAAEVQERVLGEVETAWAGCRSAGLEAAGLDSVRAGAAARARVAGEAFARGETGRLELLLTELELRRVERRAVEAHAREGAAGLVLDRALGTWYDGALMGEVKP